MTGRRGRGSIRDGFCYDILCRVVFWYIMVRILVVFVVLHEVLCISSPLISSSLAKVLASAFFSSALPLQLMIPSVIF